MPAIPSSLLEPMWVQFEALPPERPAFDPAHPLGCHRRRVPHRVVLAHVVDALAPDTNASPRDDGLLQ